MTTRTDEVLTQLKTQTALLKKIITLLEQSTTELSPNYRRRLNEYSNMDWGSIRAKVVASDHQGAVELEWNRHRFDRRMGDKYGGPFIIFSRPAGKNGDVQAYHTLIRFADYNDAPLVDAQPQNRQEARNQPSQAQQRPPAPPRTNAPTTETSQDTDSPQALASLAAPHLESGALPLDEYTRISQSPGTFAEKAAEVMEIVGPIQPA